MENTNVYGLKFANSNYLAFLTTTKIKKEILQTLVITKAIFEILRVAKYLKSCDIPFKTFLPAHPH